MTITAAQIDIWRGRASETQNLEFKAAGNQYDTRKLCRYCVAIANEGGGHLVLGIADKPPRAVVGSQAFPNLLDIAEKLFHWVGFRVDVEAVAHPDGRVVVFSMPGRPRGTAYHYEGAYLMRSGEELVPMSEDQLRKIFAEGQPSWLENPALKDASAQDVVQLLDTQTFFDLMRLPYPTDQAGVLARLLDERLIERSTAGFNILHIGAVLLAKNMRQFPEIGRKAARVIVYAGESKMQTVSDVTGEKGYAVGFSGLVQYVMGKLPQNEVIEGAIRKEVKLLPEVVVRELLANALIHQDFDMSGSDRVRACYQHCVLQYVLRKQMTNQSLRERFGLSEGSSNTVSQIITATMEQGLVKNDPNAPDSRRYARYIPAWA